MQLSLENCPKGRERGVVCSNVEASELVLDWVASWRDNNTLIQSKVDLMFTTVQRYSEQQADCRDQVASLPTQQQGDFCRCQQQISIGLWPLSQGRSWICLCAYL